MQGLTLPKRLILRTIEIFKFYVLKPPIVVRNSSSCIILGSNYGKKIIETYQLSDRPLVLSVGVGEDVSFDIEMINKFNARIILVDPTPRSAKYFEQLLLGLGKSAITGYSDSGYQPITSYDLEGVDSDQLTFVNLALSDHKGDITLFAPAQDNHVSYSSIDFYGTGIGRARQFASTTIAELLNDLNLRKSEIDVLKLDVEGGEYAILKSAFRDGIFPKQICFEIDELNFTSFKNYIRTIRMLYLLRRHGYKLRGRLAWVEFCAIKS